MPIKFSAGSHQTATMWPQLMVHNIRYDIALYCQCGKPSVFIARARKKSFSLSMAQI